MYTTNPSPPTTAKTTARRVPAKDNNFLRVDLARIAALADKPTPAKASKT